MNELIDAIFEAVKSKYKIVSTPRNQLGEQLMQKWVVFREQESDKLKQVQFIVEEDIKTFTSFKLDPAGKSALTVLRHLGRIKEHRSEGWVRLVIHSA